ncbi:MAG TPA: phosphoribosyl-ATP diphosphatase [Pyrinomonadaceae bacterium]|nr:phosphoribosyl-ATP diphosphatase [Pyrinomonadaceae bacterium]
MGFALWCAERLCLSGKAPHHLEASETIIAAKNDDKGPLVSESADLLYHLIVLLVGRGVSLDQVKDELITRRSEVKPTPE